MHNRIQHFFSGRGADKKRRKVMLDTIEASESNSLLSHDRPDRIVLSSRNDMAHEQPERELLATAERAGQLGQRMLLLLKTPPPFGGGEIRAAALRDHVKGLPDFISEELSSPQRDKSNQGSFAIWKVREFLHTWWRVARLIRRERPALLYYSLPKSFWPFVRDSLIFWTARAHRVAVVAELAGATFYFLGQARHKAAYGRFVLKRHACVRVLGSGVARTLAEVGVTNTVVTDNGIRPPNLQMKSVQHFEKIRLLFVGTHSPQKGFDQFVEACAELARRQRDFAVNTMGEWISPAFQQEMSARLRENGLEERFWFHGLKHGEDKWAVYLDSDILVLPSVAEGQPLVILEAFACGMPVVATHVGAIPDTVQDGLNGILVVPGDKRGLSAAVERLLCDAELRARMARENLTLFKRRFTEERFLSTQVAWLRACAAGAITPQGQVFRHPERD